MCNEAVVLTTPMTCHTCRECLLRVMEPDKGADEVICLSCGGFGEYKEVLKGASLKGQAFTRHHVDRLQQGVEHAMKHYQIGSL
jgi:hypothetical protein